MIPYHQFQRYNNAKLFIDSLRGNNERFSILEVGANVHRNLKKFCPQDNITFLEKNLPEDYYKQSNSEKDIILGDACCMDFADNQFDIVVALDVYEHIDPFERNKFVKEITRVAKKAVFLSAPFNFEENIELERNLIEFAKANLTEIPSWLYEHQQCGLPDINTFEKNLSTLGLCFFSYRHGSIKLNDSLLKVELIAGGAPSGVCNLEKAWKVYNKKLFYLDFCKDGSRSFYAISKDCRNLINIKMIINKYQKNSLNKQYIEKINIYIEEIKDSYQSLIQNNNSSEKDNDFSGGNVYNSKIENRFKVFILKHISKDNFLKLKKLYHYIKER